MLLKWLFTVLAVLWLIQALRPYFMISPRPPQQPPPAPPSGQSASFHSPGDEGEYIDYEEIK